MPGFSAALATARSTLATVGLGSCGLTRRIRVRIWRGTRGKAGAGARASAASGSAVAEAAAVLAATAVASLSSIGPSTQATERWRSE